LSAPARSAAERLALFRLFGGLGLGGRGLAGLGVGGLDLGGFGGGGRDHAAGGWRVGRTLLLLHPVLQVCVTDR